MQRSAGLTLVLGLWLGATLAILAVITYNFRGIEPSVENNRKLAEHLDVAADKIGERDVRRTSVLYVYAGELNRAQFYVWNRVQLLLAATALLVALLRCPRAGVVVSLMGAAVLVLAMTFYLAPEITHLGRHLDFQERTAPGAQENFRHFELLHRSYGVCELAKSALVAVAAFLALRRKR